MLKNKDWAIIAFGAALSAIIASSVLRAMSNNDDLWFLRTLLVAVVVGLTVRFLAEWRLKAKK